MTHSHSHDHHSHNSQPLENINRAFIIGISLNFLFVIIEIIAGLNISSLSLLSDAGHNLADVGTLALSLLAFRLVRVKPNEQYTYGYSKTTILVALLNAVVLLVSIGAIAYEAFHKIQNPQPLPGRVIVIVAAIGIIINTLTALFFFREKDKDLNIRSAYVHLMSDAFVSLGIVIGGIVIYYTHYYWIDAVLSIVIAIVILFSTWNLLIHSLRLTLDAVPSNLDLDTVKKEVETIPGVINIHHIHIWAISTNRNALTAHIMVDINSSLEEIEQIKNQVKHKLDHMNIHHTTLEVEPEKENCQNTDC
jgi:cobalt-zinc-cadmium efflux system protein